MWASAVLAVIKAIPAVYKIWKEVIDLYHEQQDAADVSKSEKVLKEREATIAAMKQPGLTDEQRGTLRRRLWELGRL